MCCDTKGVCRMQLLSLFFFPLNSYVSLCTSQTLEGRPNTPKQNHHIRHDSSLVRAFVASTRPKFYSQPCVCPSAGTFSTSSPADLGRFRSLNPTRQTMDPPECTEKLLPRVLRRRCSWPRYIFVVFLVTNRQGPPIHWITLLSFVEAI